MSIRIVSVLGVCAMITSCVTTPVKQTAEIPLVRAAEDDTLIPVRQGETGKQPFWNTYAKQFIYVPSFDFPRAEGAAAYYFQAEDRFGVTHSFTADSPCALLTPVWKQLPAGPVFLTVDALNAEGEKISTVATRVFFRNAPFNGCYPPAVRTYAEAARMAYDYLFSMKEIRVLADGKPDPDFELFCYPSKMYSAIINGMINYAGMVPEKKAEAYAVARGAADYLIEKAVPEGQKLEYLPQTYEGDRLAAKKFAGTIMMLYPANAGIAMINLHKAVKEPKYLDYAVKLGEQYLRLQQPNGSWYLNLRISDGKPKEKNYCVPTGIMEFLEKLSEITGDRKYMRAAEKGIPHLRKMIRSFNWEGQFEDVEAQHTPYLNMTFHNAASLCLYLCRKGPVSKKMIREVREILRYSEDQFVIWEQPGWAGSSNVWNWRTKEELRIKKWGWFRHYHVPCTLEQYRCYVPIDSASAKMIRLYLLMYKLEKNPLDLAKAYALGDSLTRLQESSGRIPTWADCDRPVKDDWINCMYGTANALKQLSEFQK